MGTHPNVILKCTIKAQGTTRKLLRELLAQNRAEVPDQDLPKRLKSDGTPVLNIRGEVVRHSRDEDDLAIGDSIYRTIVMEDTYDEANQISGEEGDLIVFDLVTYGYGKEIAWKKLQQRAEQVAAWAGAHGLTYDISVTANYW